MRIKVHKESPNREESGMFAGYSGMHTARANQGVPVNSILWQLPKEVSKNLLKKSEVLIDPSLELHS